MCSWMFTECLRVTLKALHRLSYLVFETSRCGTRVLVLQPRGVGHGEVEIICLMSQEPHLTVRGLVLLSHLPIWWSVKPNTRYGEIFTRLTDAFLIVFIIMGAHSPIRLPVSPPISLLVLKSTVLLILGSWLTYHSMTVYSGGNFCLSPAVFLLSQPCLSSSSRHCPNNPIWGLWGCRGMCWAVVPVCGGPHFLCEDKLLSTFPSEPWDFHKGGNQRSFLIYLEDNSHFMGKVKNMP